MARPRKSEAERRSRTIGVRVTTAEAAEIAERAGAARMTMGGYMRRRALGQPGEAHDMQDFTDHHSDDQARPSGSCGKMDDPFRVDQVPFSGSYWTSRGLQPQRRGSNPLRWANTQPARPPERAPQLLG